MFSPGSTRNSAGLVIRCTVHGIRASNGTTIAMANRVMIAQASDPQRRMATIEAITAQPRATAHTAGVAARITDINKAVPAARRMVPVRRDRRKPERIANGKAIAVINVPTRPCAKAPVIAGSSAYVTAIHARITLLVSIPRVATYALQPAMGAARSTSTFIAQSGLPNSTVAVIPTTMRNGAEGVPDPGPTSCQARA